MKSKMRATAVIASLAILVPAPIAFATQAVALGSSVSASVKTATKTMYTNVKAVVRMGPSTSAQKVDTLPKGTKVTVYETKNGWSRIAEKSDMSWADRWIRSDLLTSKKPTTTKLTQDQAMALVKKKNNVSKFDYFVSSDGGWVFGFQKNGECKEGKILTDGSFEFVRSCSSIGD